MIVVTHTDGKVTRVFPDGHSQLEGKNLVSVLYVLANSFPEKVLIWCHDNYYPFLNKEVISSLFVHNRILVSYDVNGTYIIPNTIGYVEDSPFVNVQKDVLYPTWKMSSDVGAIHASALVLFKTILPEGDSDYVLTSIAKSGQRHGLLCYSAPKLLDLSSLDNSDKPKDKSTRYLFRFVFQHYKTRWMYLLLLNFWIYKKRIPLLSFLKGFFHEKLLRFSPAYETVSTIPDSSFSEEGMDVIIPTIGRKKYLQDVLKDLSQQTILPKKVIIIEQNPDPSSQTELDYLSAKTWPFEIVHRFVHKTGACQARNLALMEVTAPWVFMADDDIRFSSTMIADVFSFLSAYHCKAVTLSCLMEGEQEVFKEIHQWSSFGSGCSVVASSIARQTLYDTSFEFGYGEDKDYGMQLRNRGCDVLYNPFIQLTHLKAPVGGFREPVVKPWENEKDPPKPAPTVLLFKLKHRIKEQVHGYKVLLFLKFYKQQSNKNPISYLKEMKKRWNSSVFWAHQIQKS